jgi:homoserine O-acetyltransferase/O-succinyltransferase
MGGMLVLEWAYFGIDYVRAIVPIATSSRHSAWGISWGEAQRQSIYCDPKYQDGYYSFEEPPAAGLGAARMSALLTYRSRNSFESRFGRNTPDASRRNTGASSDGYVAHKPTTPGDEHWAVHNDGHKTAKRISRNGSYSSTIGIGASITKNDPAKVQLADPQFSGDRTEAAIPLPSTPDSPSRNGQTNTYFSAQSYLRYQGEKFVKRFDSNCYIAITRKLDTHDISRGRSSPDSTDPVKEALSKIAQPALVLGIESDGLFTFAEQAEIASGIPNAQLEKIDSPEGHDAFLLQFEQVNEHILTFLKRVLPDIMGVPGLNLEDADENEGKIVKDSVFGEAEVDDITAW